MSVCGVSGVMMVPRWGGGAGCGGRRMMKVGKARL